MIIQDECASYLEISSSALLHNINVFKKESPDTLLSVVLKANAYGHGLLEVFKIIHGMVDLVCLISLKDALSVRLYEKENNSKESRILVLGAVSINELPLCADNNIEIVLADSHILNNKEDVLRILHGKKISAHIHIDTGLGREGFLSSDKEVLKTFITQVKDVVDIVGLMSHFANVEDVTEQEYAKIQLRNFNHAADYLFNEGVCCKKKVITHIAASAASLIFPDARLKMIRAGISLYGLWASNETKISAKIVCVNDLKLMPALSWRVKAQLVKRVLKDSYIGYGLTYRCDKDMDIAVFPVGYFDGLPRIVSGKGYVLIDGKRCLILGRIMMNHIVVDVSSVDLKNISHRDIVATIIGSSKDERISVETLSSWAQTINYEIVARLGAHLRRVIVE